MYCRDVGAGRVEPSSPPSGRRPGREERETASPATMKFDSTGSFHWCPAREAVEAMLSR